MIKRFFLFFLVVFSLSGCVPLLVGGAAATAAAVYVHDSRSTPQKRADQNLQRQIEHKLSAPIFRDDCHLIVSVFHGYVLLAGQAPTKELRLEAQRIALTTKGIKKLYNEIEVAKPNSTLTRISDSWISTKIRMSLLNQQSLKTVEVKVMTENGVVYLIGRASPKQVKTITSLVRHISGVQKVVKVFI